MDRDIQKFERWASKTRLIIDDCKSKGVTSDLSTKLRDSAKWVMFWGKKIQAENPKLFGEQVAGTEKALLEQSADFIMNFYSEQATIARKNRKLGSRNRVDDLFRLAYCAENYAIPFWVRSGNLDKVASILRDIVSYVAPEIPLSSDLFRIRTIGRLLGYAGELGESVPAALNERFAITAEDESVVKAHCSSLMRQAREALRTQDATTALIVSDQALEIYLRLLCRLAGCTDDTISNIGSQRTFPKWSFVDYMAFLQDKGTFTSEQKSDFFTYHEWRNQVQHLGIEPSERQVARVISSIETFMEERERTG